MDSAAADVDDSVFFTLSDLIPDDDEARAPGRISNANLDILADGLQETIKIAKDVSAKTGLAVGQIFDQWSIARSRTHLHKNMWNVYERYYKVNALEELSRVSDGETFAYAKKDVQLRLLAYDAFKEAYGDNAKKILEKFRLLEDLNATSVTTVGQRKQDFNGLLRKLEPIVRRTRMLQQQQN
ncbi:hypothetical protein C8Q76DRAFT_634391 [Earliella scabrosa]|nr:hypothetical protein C8Q76DRAFT_634391 [Earliella scabrosa]